MNVKLFLMVLVLTLAVSIVNAGITDVSILPENPTNTDAISFKISGAEGSGPVQISDVIYELTDNSITLDISIDAGLLTVVTPWDYTHNIGSLDMGTYNLTVNSLVAAIPSRNSTFTTSFEVVPEPSAILLLLAGSFMSLRKRTDRTFICR